MLIDVLTMVFPLIFSANLVMSLVKFLADGTMSRPYLRVILGIFAFAGVIFYASFTGNPVDMDSLTSLGRMILEAAIVAFGAHYSYKAIKTA